MSVRPQTRIEWCTALDSLNIDRESIPAFFFGHGSPTLLVDPSEMGHRFSGLSELAGPSSRLAKFLVDFGPALLSKYNPKAILVFSAHWETDDEILVTDYGNDQPLLMDYYGFSEDLYQVAFHSNGDSSISNRVVDVLNHAGIKARRTLRTEPRGIDGRGFHGPGLDHGVFVPFKFMFGDSFSKVPIIQASICGNLDPIANFNLGNAVSRLRSEGVLILSGGLTIHNLRNLDTFSEPTAESKLRSFHDAIFEAVEKIDPDQRKNSLIELVKHPGFSNAHPRAEHFIPIYIAAGAGGMGKAKILNAQYAAATIVFGL